MLKEIVFKIGLILAFLLPLQVFTQVKPAEPEKIYLKENWFVQKSVTLNQTGAELSSKPITKGNWYKTTVPSTVMGALTANGLYKDIFTGDNFKNIDKKQFDDCWWFYRQFTISKFKKGQHVTLNFDGISYSANIWLNGKLLTSHDTCFGTFRRFSFDISNLVNSNGNTLAVEVFRAQPGDFNIGFVDWNPRPQDENMGIWRPVYLEISGDVSLRNTYVESDLNTATLNEASLTVKTSLKNNSLKTVIGILKGKIENIEFSYPVQIEPGQAIDLKLTPAEIPALRMNNPRIWWCNNLGSPELYHLDLRFEANGITTDKQKVTFGIRKIEIYTNAAGHKGFKLNGKEILVKGAGWTDDIFLRDSLQSIETQIQYVKHMNLNTIRLEGFWGNNQDIYDLCDKFGILIMVGWSCHWEWDEYLGKSCGDFGGIQTDSDIALALKSFRDQLLWLRNHPSVMVWMVGSDKCPKPELEISYANLIKSIDNRPYLVSAGTRVSTISGPSGVKMNGPYEYVSPNYWYIDTINGGAFGFNTETGPGPQVPVLESVKKMIPADKLWPPNELWDYHCTHSKQAFNKMEVYNAALEARYGKDENLGDYLLKSDAQSYEAMRGMFEAFRVNIPKTTGIIQWMLNSAWPSMYWHLYDYYLRPSAAYYAARNANQPVQIIYNYGNNSVYAVNETHSEVKNINAGIISLDINSKIVGNKDINITIPANSSVKVMQLDTLTGNGFLSLKLTDINGKHIAGNFYWLSEKPDEFAWDKTTWAYTPMKAYTDFTALGKLPVSNILISCKTEIKGSDHVIHTWISNPTDKLAFFISLTLNDEKGISICPVFWEDNYISLLPGEQREISCTISQKLLANTKSQLSISGWNIKPQSIGIK